ncbi:hypothetical protein QBC39DRAFT_368846 [Podospora conica]|nr:hypothetical protein QBC39DRAFT_368846 [Schizothecium conicum]
MAAVAPMELLKSDPSAIPLKCTLCPKRPNFSDVSHLLTHISSKSHLSHRFKTELKALSEPECQERLRIYEEWYNRHGIRALLAERMSTKDQKPTAKRGRPAHTPAAQNSGSAPPRRNNTSSVKIEAPDSNSTTPIYSHNWSANSHLVLPFRGANRAAIPEFFDRPDRPSPIIKRSLSDEYSVPSTPDAMSAYGSHRWPSESSGEPGPIDNYHPGDNADHLHVLHVELPPEDERDKLKGVRYPGMGLFDSASEQDRKKRNQKKDASVLVRMEETSAGIEPLESIWEADGELQRIRDIYASPSPEGTPDRELAETTEQRVKRARRNPATKPPASSAVQTRSSARIAQYSNTSGKQQNRRRGTDADHSSHGSGHGHFQGQPLDGYDVFQPRRGSGHETLGHGVSPRLGGRHALSGLSSNAIIGDSQKPSKSHQRFPARAGEGTAGFQPHPAAASNQYFHQQQGPMNNNFNPLYVEAANRNGMFHPYNNYGQRYGPGPMAPNTFDGYLPQYSPSNESAGPFQHPFPPPPRSGNDNFDLGN